MSTRKLCVLLLIGLFGLQVWTFPALAAAPPPKTTELEPIEIEPELAAPTPPVPAVPRWLILWLWPVSFPGR